MIIETSSYDLANSLSRIRKMSQALNVSRKKILNKWLKCHVLLFLPNLYSNSGWLGLINTDLDDFGGSIYILLFAGVGKDLDCSCHMSMGTGRETGHYLGGYLW